MPKVSIILAVYNGERYLSKAIDSILTQSFGDLELLIVNDGSADGSREIVDAYARSDTRVRVFHQQQSGRPGFPRNFALDKVEGDYVGFIDHDDWCDPDRLRQMVEALETHPQWIAAFHDVRNVDPDGRERLGTWFHNHKSFVEGRKHFVNLGGGWHESGPEYFPVTCQNLTSLAITIHSVLIGRHRIDFSKFRFDTEYAIVDDTDMWMQLVLQGRFGYLDRVLSYYRLHPDGITKNHRSLAIDNLLLHRKNYERAKKHLDPAGLADYRLRIADFYAETAWSFESVGDVELARAQYRAAIEWSGGMRHWFALAKSYPPLSTVRAAFKAAAPAQS